jgi:hypothetical protein
MKRNILQCILWLLLPVVTIAQTPDSRTRTEKRTERRERINKLIKQEEEGALIYQKQNLFAIKLYSDGYAAMFEKGYLKTATRATLFSLELGERKSPKEVRVGSQFQSSFFSTNSYIFGKINNFYFAKLGVGQSLLIGGKGNRNGVAVTAVGNGGLSLGLLKPYYLNVSPGGQEELQVKFMGGSAPTDTLFLDPSRIIRGSGITKGFSELKVKPGLFAKAGLRFDYGHYNETISAIEVGLNAEYYFGKVPQMAFDKEKNLFLNLFVALEFGKRK